MYSDLNDILFVIVLYNLEIHNSTTYRSLQKAVKHTDERSKVDLYIYDNSLLESSFSQIDWKIFSVQYVHDRRNSGVSLAYNKASEYAAAKNKKWVLVFDQDTTIPVDALTKYLEAIREWPGQPVYVPKLYSHNILLSPCQYHFYKGFHLKNIDTGLNVIARRNILNSGALINLDAYRVVNGYDENVWLYFSDFVFFNRLKKYYNYFVVVDIIYEHELSSDNYKNLEFAKSRFSLYCEGAKFASRSDKSIFAHFSYFVTVFLRSILLSLRLKNITFISIFTRKFF